MPDCVPSCACRERGGGGGGGGGRRCGVAVWTTNLQGMLLRQMPAATDADLRKHVASSSH